LWLRENTKRPIRAKRLISGSMGISLMETEMLVQDAYRRKRIIEQQYSSRLRESILLSAFQYTNFDIDDFNPEKNSWQERRGLLERKKESKDALSKIGLDDTNVSNEVENFFNKLNTLFESFQKNKEGIAVEWLLNKTQVDR